MSWSNPSSNEAESAYYSAKNAYSNAANQKSASERAESNYISEKNSCASSIQSCQNEKRNFEKRIAGIGEIIKALEGSGGGGVDVPSGISKVNSAAGNADTSYRGSIKCAEITRADFNDVFKAKSVYEDANSSGALSAYKSEKARLEQAVAELEARIASLFASIDSLTSKIKSCNAAQASYSHTMSSAAYDMNHYKKYMN